MNGVASAADASRLRRVAVAGAGMGGLMSALALARHGLDVTLFERDAAPPRGAVPRASMAWRRRGVPQSRHPHFFMGRLRVLLEARYPEFVQRLLDAGVGESGLDDYLHPGLRGGYRPVPEDADLRTLNARRTTFEMILRDYVLENDRIRLWDDAAATGLVMETGVGPPRVVGVEVSSGGGSEAYLADAVIDATGRFGRLVETLARRGVPMAVEQRDSGIWYFTRHYRLKPGCSYPPIHGLPGASFADFVVGALPADNGAFTVTFQIYRSDRAVAKALREPSHFDAMCRAVGAIAPWVDPARAEATSEVFGFAHMDSFWRSLAPAGAPAVLGFFCVGDSAIRSNPKFGRGCTWTAVAAHHLADLMAAELTPEARLLRYEAILEKEFRRDWQVMQRLDASAERAFETATGARPSGVRDRLASAFQTLVNDACVIEPVVFRETWAGYHGLTGMTRWLQRPGVWWRLARAAVRRRRFRALLDVAHQRPTRRRLAAGAQVGRVDPR